MLNELKLIIDGLEAVECTLAPMHKDLTQPGGTCTPTRNLRNLFFLKKKIPGGVCPAGIFFKVRNF